MKKFMLLFILVLELFANVNINTATLKELSHLKGIGKTKAMAIIAYRKKHPFTKVEDILKVKGIGKKTFEKIKGEISVGGKNN